MTRKRLWTAMLALLALLVVALCAPTWAAEVWRDPKYDIFALRKVFVLPINANLKARAESSVVPQSQRKSELDGWAVSSLQAALKKNKPIVKAAIDVFIMCLPVSKEIKAELAAITPENYTGYNY